MENKETKKQLKKYLKTSKGMLNKELSLTEVTKFTTPFVAIALPMLPVALNGQCMGNSPAVVHNLTAGSVSIDVNGGGDDFRFKLDEGNPVLSIINAGFNIGTRSGGAAMNVPNNNTIRTGAYSAGAPGPYFLTGGGAYGSIQGATGTVIRLTDNFGAGYVPIVNGGSVGFIELSVSGTSVTIGEFGLDSNGGTTIAGDCASLDTALPVELVRFQAVVKGKNVNLGWETATETNNAGFEIERSTDGKKFKAITWIEGHGTSTDTQRYLFEDTNLGGSYTYYYRLKQVDFDGAFEYSEIVSVRLQQGHDQVGAFYPNPVTAFSATIEINVREDEKWTAAIFDSAGRAIFSEQRFLEAGTTTKWDLDLSSLSQGIFFVKFENGKGQYYRKLVIE